MKRAFLDKLLARLDRLDPDEARRLLQRMTREQGLFAQVLDALVEGVVVLDPDGGIGSVNRAAAEMLRLDPQESLGQPVDKLLPFLDWRELLGRGRSATRDLELLAPEPRLLNCYVTPIAAGGEDAQTMGYALLVRDVTSSRQKTAQQIEEEKLGALTMLAAGVAHELGNPLNSLDIHLQLLQRRLDKGVPADDPGIAELLGVARGEVGRLDGLIKQFLQALRPTELNTELCDVNEVVVDSVEFLRAELEDGGVELVAHFDSNLPPLHLDRGQVRQALYNVFRNARQALRGSQGKIDISTELAGEFVRIRVADNGIGMGSSQMSQAFRAFQTTRPDGHGLGLLIVRRIVRAHGGQLTISSEEGTGTEVSLELPLAPRGLRLLPGGEEEKSDSVIDV